jgi:hypothetical protein
VAGDAAGPAPVLGAVAIDLVREIAGDPAPSLGIGRVTSRATGPATSLATSLAKSPAKSREVVGAVTAPTRIAAVLRSCVTSLNPVLKYFCVSTFT